MKPELIAFAVYFGAGVLAAFSFRAIALEIWRWWRARHPRRTGVHAGRLGKAETLNVISFRKGARRGKRANPGTASDRIARFGPGLLMLLAVSLVLVFRLLPDLMGPKAILAGTVTHVRDGDTIEVNRQPIRLNGLTCDELRTPLGDKAKAAMQRLAAGRRVTCELNGEHTYDRAVGRCRLSDGRDLGAVLISQRICGRCARYDPLRKYAAVQREAGPFEGAYPSYCWSLW
ncbi:thermonuclease family protein [Acidimangrovimonas pyrenivorans]|uniref:Thermonuclease family protein n=1 Tax=Acidimangrovimonas pyrenivorans TaxID=2030798 RepID=A0ABV7AD59_9RHOB